MNDFLARPWFLALLALIPLLWLLSRNSLASMTPLQRRLSLALRALILTLLVIALAGPHLPWHSREVAVIFALDRSASVSPAAAKAGREFIAKALAHQGRGDSATILGFAKTATLLGADGLATPDAAHPTELWPPQPDRDSTDIGRALAFAAAVFPEGKTKRLVLLSDGYDTTGANANPSGGAANEASVSGAASGMVQAAQSLPSSGVELITVPLVNPFQPEVLVERLEIPRALREGEPFNATATLRSNVDTPCVARLYANGFVSGEQTATLKPGLTVLTFRNLRPEKGTATYSLEITPERDTLAENNRAQAVAIQRGEPHVLIVDSAPDKMQPLAGALKAARMDVEVRPPEGLPATMSDLQKFDAVLLSDVSALKLSSDQMQLYSQWVREFGGGFAMLGGENSFGVGGYFHTPLEAMLPVAMDHADLTESPTVAVMIILDSSGSMTQSVAGQTKIALADQGAALALEALHPRDLFGVMAVDTQVHQIATLARHNDRAEVTQQILRVKAGGGGIYVYTSLVEAFSQLREVNAKIKHVILFSDAADAEEKAGNEMSDGSHVPGTAVDVVSAMAAARISTSVVGLGTPADKDTPFLKQLATTGGGRFYLTDDALTLPQIFTAETMRVAQSSLVEEPVVANVVGKTPVLEGIDWATAPPLLGYNVTKIKRLETGSSEVGAAADVLLATDKGDPILASWQFGLGKVAAFTSDAKSRWAADWLAWPGYGKFWGQLVRSLLRPGSEAGLEVQTTSQAGQLQVQIDATAPDGSFRNQLPLTVHATNAAGAGAESAVARQVAPGRYQATVAVSGTGTTWVSVESGALQGAGPLFGYAAPYPAEFLNNGTDADALKQLAAAAGGRFAPTPESVFAPPEIGTLRFTDLTNLLLSVAILLLPVDVWLRRRVFQ